MESISQIGLIIENIQKTLRRILRQEFKKQGLKKLNPSHGKVLFALSRNDMIPIQKLKETVALSPSTLTEILDHLENLNIITRIHSKKDRRNVLIQLNENYSDKLKLYKNIVQKVSGIMYQNISKQEKQVFEELSQKIYKNLALYERELK
jgi:DNA-binding MarR family transcriptional regulator